MNINNFILLNKIGNSFFSELYTVKDKNTGEILAAKISLNSYDNSNPLNSKLISEITEIKQFGHAAILQYIGYSPIDFHNENKLVIFSQYMPYQSLGDLLSKHNISNCWNETKKLINMYGIASAMSFLHSVDIIHGYLYPSNVLMDSHLFPIITDFQLFNLHFLSQNTIDTQRTIYTAPELCGKPDHSKAGDVYAFGMLVYEILTNERPFKNLNFLEILTKVASGNRPEIPEMNESCKNLIEKCWSQNSEDRPSFDEIKTLLRNDQSFITESIDRNEYEKYVSFIDEYQNVYEKSRERISFDDFISEKAKLFTSDLSDDLFRSMENNDDQLTDSQTEPNDNKNDLKSNNLSDSMNSRSQDIPTNSINENQNEPIYLPKSPYQNSNTTESLPQNKQENNGIFESQIQNKQENNDIFNIPTQDKPAYISEPKTDNQLYVPPKSSDVFRTMNSNHIAMPDNLLDQNQNEPIHIPESPYQNIDIPRSPYPMTQNSYANSSYFDIFDSESQNSQPNTDDSDKMATPDDFVDSSKKSLLFFPVSPLEYLNKYSAFREEPKVDSNLARFLNLFPNESRRKEAISYLRSSIKNGSTKAMNAYGALLYKGEGVEMNKEEAAKYFKMSFENGDLDGMYNYSCVLFNGQGVKANVDESVRYFQTLALDHEHVYGMNIYGALLLNGHGVPMNKEKSVSLIKTAAERGCPDAMYNYGLLLESGKVIPIDKPAAFRYFKMAADHGFIPAFLFCGIHLVNGIGVSRNENGGAQCLKIAADNGIPLAMLLYGKVRAKMLTYKSVMLNQQLSISTANECLRYFKMSADNGVVQGMMMYGKILSEGIFVPCNVRDGAWYYKMAADKGSDKEMINYANFLLSGKLGVVNMKEVAKYYKMAADKGNLSAIKAYATIMRNGKGIQSDKKEAGKYFKMAAEKGDVESMNIYGLMSLSGEIECDPREAFAYLTDAANTGYEKAIYNLGIAIYKGHGTAPNRDFAIELLKKAARKGVKEAAISLKSLNIKDDKSCSIY